MDHLWTPWRYAYVTGADLISGCIFCDAPKQTDKEARIVYRGKHCYVILNTYPYTNGHVMVVPYEHLDELQKLPIEAAQEMMALIQKMESVLRALYVPDGINLGMNIGRAAGAGVAGHIHMHILPRWVADANFLSVGWRDTSSAGVTGCYLGADSKRAALIKEPVNYRRLVSATVYVSSNSQVSRGISLYSHNFARSLQSCATLKIPATFSLISSSLDVINTLPIP